MKNGIQYVGLLLVFVLTIPLLNCKKEEPKTPISIPQDKEFDLTLFPSRMAMGESAQAKIYLSTNSDVPIEWSLTSKPDWIIISPANGSIDLNSTQEITIGSFNSGLVESEYLNSITFSSSDANEGSFEVNTIVDYNIQYPTYSHHLLNFGTEENMLTMSVETGTDFPVYWKSKNVPPHLEVGLGEGYYILSSNVLDVNVDRSQLYYPGIYVDTILMESSLGTQYQFIVSVEHEAEAGMWPISYKLQDVEYNNQTNTIVAACKNQHLLLLLDPEEQTQVEIPLPKLPLCVNVGINGQFAAVGYDGFCSLVDLASNTVIDTWPVSAKAFDIILGPNMWIYVFPTSSGSYYAGIKCINTNTGQETQSIGNAQINGYVARLHPSGNYIYCKTTISSGDNIYKYDISNDTAILLYQSYMFSYNNYDNLWISNLGDQIFTMGRNAFTSTEVEATDMQFINSFNGPGMVHWLDDSPGKNLFAALIREQAGYNWHAINLYTFSLDNFNPIDTFSLPKYQAKNLATQFEPDGRYVFIQEDGNIAWVVQEAEEDYPEPLSWAIVKIDLN